MEVEIGPRALDIRAAASYLSVPTKTIRRLYLNNELPFVRLGKRYIFRREDLDAVLDRLVGFHSCATKTQALKNANNSFEIRRIHDK